MLSAKAKRLRRAGSANVRGCLLCGDCSVAVRIVLLAWMFGFFALGFLALAETIFGIGSFAGRLENFLPRLAISLLWPLAVLTPRGRYLLWARWRREQ